MIAFSELLELKLMEVVVSCILTMTASLPATDRPNHQLVIILTFTFILTVNCTFMFTLSFMFTLTLHHHHHQQHHQHLPFIKNFLQVGHSIMAGVEGMVNHITSRRWPQQSQLFFTVTLMVTFMVNLMVNLISQPKTRRSLVDFLVLWRLLGHLWLSGELCSDPHKD